jgi:hypothetical protein
MKEIWKKIVDGWRHFFFDPTSPATLGLYRIGLGIVLFLSNLGRFPCRDLFYGENGIVRFQTINHFFPPFLPQWLFLRWLPLTEPQLEYFFVALLVLNIMFIFGLFSRITTILFFLGTLTLANRNPLVDNAGELILRCNLFYLMFTNPGSAYSLDRYIGKKRGLLPDKLEPISPWVIRLLQLQLSYVYIDTVYLKLDGLGWRDGTAMYYALNYLELRRFDLRFLFYNLPIIKFATYSTLIGEASVGTLIWFRKLRYWMIGLGVFLHEGINLTMQFPVFQYAMMASLVIFISPEDSERIVAYLSRIGSKLTNFTGFRPLRTP